MPMRDNFLTLSGGTTAGQQTLSAAAGSYSTAGPYSPFDLGQLISSEYGQSPYMSTSLLSTFSALGQSVKKFFFLVYLTQWMSGGSATTGITVELMSALTVAATYNVVVQTAKITKPYLSTAANWGLPLIKVSIPEGIFMSRYIKGLFVTSSTQTHTKFVCELTEY